MRVEAADAGRRLDQLLAARLPDLSRSRLRQLIDDGAVSVAGTLPLGLSDLAAIQARGSLLLAGGRDSAGNPQSTILTVTLRR